MIYAASVNRHIVKITEEAIYSHNDEIGETSADCILILGCGVYADGTPSPMLADRLKTGIELYKKGAAPKIIMSGDHGRENYDEVNVMKQYAIESGVPSEDIFMDHAGFSTYESVYRAKEIFCIDSLIIVTQKYHLSRALYIADRFDLEAIGVSADLRSYSGQSMRDKREFIARNKDFLSCIFKPKPTFLGEEIPVNGNGDITNDK
jgi:vancomycin permeability regulator SanA